MPRPDRLDTLKDEVKKFRQEFDDFAKEHKAPLDVLQEWAWANKWKIVKWVAGTISAVVVGFVGVGYKVWPHIESASGTWADARIAGQLKQPKEDLDKLGKDVSAIKTQLDTLKPLIDGMLLDRFRSAVTLPQGEFQSRLPEVQNLIGLARQRGVVVNPELVRRISEKLLSIKPRKPDFWPTSAQLVSYRSSNGAPSIVLQLATAKLQDCTDSEPQPMRITAVLSPREAKFSNALYENCRITLDSPTDNDRINSLLRGRFPRLTFRNCLVVYRGGQINLMLEWKGEVIGMQVEGKPPMTVKMSGNTMEFENCLLEFTVQGVPPPIGQKVTEVLLAQNTESLKLPHP
jgi:hypothetical protein